MKKLTAIIISFISVFTLITANTGVRAAEAQVKAGIVVTESDRLIVRESATSKSTAIYSVAKNGYITLISKSGSWWSVEYSSGKYGYCHADYIKEISTESATVATQSGSLNIRAGAGSAYKSIGVAEKGSTVTVIDTADGWSKILFNGSKVGYVSSAYLKFSQKYSAVSLSVPSFKQNDTRWANVKIGSSGKTIAEIGCVTTGISMLESFRTGTSIYPDAMSKKLTYTSSGNVYWPSDYTTVYWSNSYLEEIYRLLKQGKPVLFGSKSKSGGQHWVVITGYTGGDVLSASGFTVNDPGSSRKNLQQHLNSYPTFYKFLHY